VLRARERGPTPSPSAVFFLGLVAESIKELGGALGVINHFSSNSHVDSFINHKAKKDQPPHIHD